MLQARRLQLAQGCCRRLLQGPFRGALQEHAEGDICQRLLPEHQDRGHGHGRGRDWARPRNSDPRRPYRRAADEVQGHRPRDGRVQEDIPQGAPVRHRTLAECHCQGAGDHDQGSQHRSRNGSRDEDRRCRVPGRRDQGHILLYRRRQGGLPPADQGVRGGVPHTHRDEADRRAPGGRAHRRPGNLRPRALLCQLYLLVPEHLDFCRPRPGLVAQPPETRGAVRKAQVLPELRGSGISRRPVAHPQAVRPA